MTSWAENNIPKQDFAIMQHDAVRRVKEMQRQAMDNLEKTKSSFSQNEKLQPEEYANTPPENTQTQQNNQQNYNQQNYNQQNYNQQNNQQNYNQQNNDSWANNKGYIGVNQNPHSQPFQSNQHDKKSPFSFLNGLFSKNSNVKGGFSDIINGLLPKKDGDSPISKILDALDLDTEKLIIIVLIILLLNDGADYTLILALGYILL